MKKALIIIDMQNDFIDGALGTQEAQKIVPLVAEKLAAARKASVDVIFTRDTHTSSYSQTQEGKKLPVEHCIKGSIGHEISAALMTNDAKIIDKQTFGSAELAAFVKESGYDTIELCGLCTDICVISNAMILKAFLPEAKISVDSSCCAGTTPENHENALSAMKMCQIDII